MRPLLLALAMSVATVATEGQGVYRVLFADLAVVRIDIDLPASAEGEGHVGPSGGRFSLMAEIDNLGDLPARDGMGEVRVFITARSELPSGVYEELTPIRWRYSSGVYLGDSVPPSGNRLHSLQTGALVAEGLHLPQRPGRYDVRVCILFVKGPPFGNDIGNDCSTAVPVTVRTTE